MSDVERVRAAADIVALIACYVKLERCGVQYRGLCPFHTEKSPSFYVHPKKQMFHCHGCAAGGDVFAFIMRIEACDFRRALGIVADRAGVPIDNHPLTRQERHVFAEHSAWRELVEHFHLRFGVTEELAPRYLKWSCAVDPGFRDWLAEDLAHVHAITAVVVAMLATAQERDKEVAAA